MRLRRLPGWCRSAWLLCIAIVALVARPAAGQILLDTFTDGVPGTYWQAESGNPAIQINEIGGQLRLSCSYDPAMANNSYAGYVAKNWRLRSTTEFLVRVSFYSFPGGIDFSIPGSRFGIGMLLYDCEAIPAANRLREGTSIAIGALMGTGSWTRDFTVDRVTLAGDLVPRDRWYAFPSYPTEFYWAPNPAYYTEIGIQGTLYLRYQPASDRIVVSTVGYNDPEALVYYNITGGTGRPQQIALGGFARYPGGTNSNIAWVDDFRVDAGIIETAPIGFNASDGTDTTKVRLTWPSALGATGYRIKRSTGGAEPTLLATLASNVIGYDDTSAVPAVLYAYTIETMNPSGPPFAVSDNGFRNVPAPTGLVASEGTLTEGVSLSWSPVTDAIGYLVERRLGNTAPVEVGAPEGTVFLDTTGTPGVVYTYSVRARTAAGNSAPSATDTGWRGLLPPTGVAASDGASTTAVNLTWNAASGATGYRVFRAIGAATPTQIATPTTNSYADASAAPGTVYAYTVKSSAAAGLSAPSEVDTGWRNVSPPAGLQASDGTSTDGVNLTWTALPGAISYRVFRAIGSGTPELIATPTANSAFDGSAAYATVYSYTVRAMIAAGETGPSVANTGWRNIPAPTGLVATDGVLTTGVDLGWNGSDLATGYVVFRAVGTGAPTQIGQTAANGFADTTAAAGTLYTYTVRATTAPGNSGPSAADTGWRNRPAPTGVAATDGTLTTGVQVSWAAVSGATGYRVFRGIGGETPAEIAAPAAGPYLDTNAVSGVTYTYRVTTRSAAGDSVPSLPDTGYRGVPAPTGVAATDGTRTDGVEISWTPVAGAVDYRVFRQLGSAAPVEVGVTGSSPFLDVPVAGTVFSYTVRARNAVGESVASAANTGWRNLPAPTGLVATDGSQTNGVNLAWNAVAGATGYRVFRAIGTAAPAQIAAPAATATTYLDAAAAAGTTYTYTVRAASAAGNSDAGTPDTGWRNVVAPGNLQATQGTRSDGVNLTWTGSAGAAGYRIYRSVGAGTPSVIAEPTATSFLDTTADVGVTFTYEVRARTASGESNPPNPTRTGFRTMPAPSGIVASDGTSPIAVNVAWNPIPGVSTYRIYRANGTAVPNVQVGEVSAGTSFADISATVGTIFNYTVRGVFNGSESASGVANTGWRTIAAPASVAATDGTSTANVTVTWSAVPGTLDYRVYRAPAAGGTAALVGTVAATLTTFADTSAAPGQPFNYTVFARTTPGLSLASPSDLGWRDVVVPANLNATLGTVTAGVNLTWTASPGANGYSVLRGTSEATLAPIAQTTTATWPDATAEPGVTYQYRVKALTPAGPSNGVGSVIKPGWRNVPAPAGFTASQGTSTAGVDLTWSAVPGATTYRIERIGVASPLGTPAGTSFTDTTIIAGTVATYRITAITPSGPSLANATKTGWRNVPAPTNLLAADGISTLNVALTWTGIGSVPGLTGFRVYRAAGAATPTAIATVAPTATAYSDTGAVPGTAYTYSVRSVTAAGESIGNPTDAGWRNVVAPANLQATDGTVTTGVNLTWTAVANATGYRILRGATVGELAEIATSTAASFADTTAVAGTVSQYAVIALTQAGASAASQPNSGWRNVPAPAAFAAGDGLATTSIELTWQAVPGASGYKVFRANGTATPTTMIAEVTDPAAIGFSDASAAVTGAPAGTLFNYLVKATTSAGDSTGTAANTGWRNVPAPTNLQATDGASLANVGLSWTGIGIVPGHTGFRIYRSTGTGTPAVIATVAITATAFIDTTAVAGTPYLYSVRSVTAAGESIGNPTDEGWRNVAAPAGVAATDTDPSKVRVTWNAVSGTGVIGYAIFRQLPGEEAPVEIGLVGGTPPATAFNDLSIEPGVVGTYTVRTRTAAGLSQPSAADTGVRPVPLVDAGSGDGTAGRISTGGDVPFAGTGRGKDGPAGGTGNGDGDGGTAPPPTVSDDRPIANGEAIACETVIERLVERIAELETDGSPEALDESDRLAALLGDDGDPETSPACRMATGDVNLDGRIDADDLASLLFAWTAGDLVTGDLDRDGLIDGEDLALVLGGLEGSAVE
jgi:fibronectin type 3 domain-containing protein